MDSITFKKPVVLVTGSNSGIGLGFVRQLLSRYGDKICIYMACRNLDKAEEVFFLIFLLILFFRLIWRFDFEIRLAVS